LVIYDRHYTQSTEEVFCQLIFSYLSFQNEVMHSELM